MKHTSTNELQRSTCLRFDAEYCEASPGMKVGISANVRAGALPVNGLRHAPTDDTTGWYIWAGEDLSEAPDFFLPLHVGHLDEWCPQVTKYLGLPPGWRFLIAGDYEDVWYDESLLHVS